MPTLADLKLPDTSARLRREVLDEVRDRTRETCQQLGILRSDRMPLEKYLAGRFELLVALAYPDADVDELVLCNDFNTYLFYVDDLADETEAYGKSPDVLQHYLSQHVEALGEGTLRSEHDPAAALLISIRQRLLRSVSPAWLDRFVQDVRDYLMRGTMTSARNWTAGTVPTLAEYTEHRAWDSAVPCVQDLIEVAGAGELPVHVHARDDFATLRRLCTHVAAFTNDLVSYSKEVRDHDSPNNLVHVIMVHEGLTLPCALERVIAIINDAAEEFERLAAALPHFDGDTDARVARYLSSLRAWMGGNLLWSLASGRYADPASPLAELRTSPPTSLTHRMPQTSSSGRASHR
jgi:hypothetical protein